MVSNTASTKLLASLLLMLVVASVSPAYPAAIGPQCFGKKATIVGTNRDPLKTVALKGTPGNDVIVGLEGADRIFGQGGNDLICLGGGDDYVKAGPGNDRVKGQGGQDTLYGGGGDDRMWGGGNTDSLLGGPGKDRLYGGAGPEDALLGGPGDDFLHGGAGYDLVEFWQSPRGIEADLRTGVATGHGNDQLVSIEGLIGSNFDDVLYGDDRSNMIQSGAGDDQIYAFGSDLDDGTDLLRTSGGDNFVDGGDGPDMISYNLAPWPVAVDLSLGTTTSESGTDTLVGIEHLVGSKEDDVLIGNDEDNLIVGNWGSDVIDGRGGVDELAYFDNTEAVVVDLGAGTADAGRRGSDTFVDFENLSGSAWRDTLIGDDGPNVIWGESGGDLLVGLGDDDALIGGSGNDEADGGDGTDQCQAEVHNCEIELLAATLRSYLPSFSTWLGLKWSL